MKQVLLLALATFSFARLGVAASCSNASLAAYVSLGTGGCTIGGNTLSDFTILSGIAGATPILPSAITIMPTGSSFNPGLTISMTQTANTGSLLEIIFTYQIAGLKYAGSSLLLSGSSEPGGGDVTGIENFCGDGTFGPDGVSGCTGTNGTLVTLDGTQQSDMGTFGSVSILHVTNDLAIDSTFGSATAGKLADSFAAVPEPVSLTLAGLGLAFVGATKLRSKRVKEENK
jgi:hypothetical protein